MISAIRRDVRTRRVRHTPVILENHTKDIVDFSAIERFAAYISKQLDLEVITLSQLAHRLAASEYPVLTKGRAA